MSRTISKKTKIVAFFNDYQHQIMNSNTNLEQVGLDVNKTGVKDEIQLGLVGHLGHIRRTVHRFSDVQDFFCQQFSNLFPV
jgi:hypothetical protein